MQNDNVTDSSVKWAGFVVLGTLKYRMNQIVFICNLFPF